MRVEQLEPAEVWVGMRLATWTLVAKHLTLRREELLQVEGREQDADVGSRGIRDQRLRDVKLACTQIAVLFG